MDSSYLFRSILLEQLQAGQRQAGDRLPTERAFSEQHGISRSTVRKVLADMAVHAIPDADPPADLCAFEADLLKQQGLPAAVGQNHRLVHFQHLFSGSGYAAGYYVYLWAEVLDCDAFEAFKEAGDIFDPNTAQRLLRCIYAAGNRVEPGQTYREFRGRDARVEPMLRDRGLIPEEA